MKTDFPAIARARKLFERRVQREAERVGSIGRVHAPRVAEWSVEADIVDVKHPEFPHSNDGSFLLLCKDV